MLKQVHKFLIAVVLGCVLSAPSIVIAENEIMSVNGDASQNSEVELAQEPIHIEESDIEPINTSKVKQSVVPDPAKEGKKVIGLFFKVMAAVAFCAILIYIILLFAKKFYFNNLSEIDAEELDSLDLSTPNNRNDALKSFLNRTK